VDKGVGVELRGEERAVRKLPRYDE